MFHAIICAAKARMEREEMTYDQAGSPGDCQRRIAGNHNSRGTRTEVLVRLLCFQCLKDARTRSQMSRAGATALEETCPGIVQYIWEDPGRRSQDSPMAHRSRDSQPSEAAKGDGGDRVEGRISPNDSKGLK